MPSRAAPKPATANGPVVIYPAAAAAEPAAAADPLEGSALFDLGDGSPQIARVGVLRDEPIEEGHIGYVPPDATEDDIRRRYGGGVYRLQGKTERGQHIKGAFRTIRISGEPKFTDPVAEAKYSRLRRQELGIQAVAEQQAPRDQQPSLLQLLDVQERKAELARQQAREEYERREAERDAAHKREMERLRLEAEGRERERKAEEERRERERHADDLRRSKEQEESRARDREFFAGMLKLNKEESKSGGVSGMEGALRLVMAAREMFAGQGESGSDPVTELMKNIPAILDRSSGIAAQIAGTAPAAAPAEPGVAQGGGEDPEALTISGAHARELQAAIDNLRAQGIDPDKALLWQFRQLANARRRAPAQPASPAADVSAPDGKQSTPAQASPAPARSRKRSARPARRR